MSLHLNRGKTQFKDGTAYPFWEVRETFWDKEIKSNRQRYIGYVGKEPVITKSKALKICEKKDLTLEQLENVNGLTIIPDPEPNGKPSTVEHKRFEALLAQLGRDFDQKVLDDPEFAGSLPRHAHIVFQLDVGQADQGAMLNEAQAFNEWSQELAQINHEPGQPLVTVTLHLQQLAGQPGEKRHRLTAQTIGQAARNFELATV